MKVATNAGAIIATGYAGKDAEERRTTAGKGLVSFSIAVESGGNKPAVWQNCTVWQGAPFWDHALTIRKGDSVAVMGTNHSREYTDKGTGEVKTTSDCWVEWMDVKGKDHTFPPKPTTTNQVYAQSQMENEDELPF